MKIYDNCNEFTWNNVLNLKINESVKKDSKKKLR